MVPTASGRPPRRWRGVPAGLTVLGIALGLSLPAFILAYPVGKKHEDDRQFLVGYRPPTIDEFWIAKTADYAVHSTGDNAVLLHGDSTCHIGLDARQFGEALGLNAFNMGTNADVGLSNYTLLLKRYLEAHPAPEAVVLCLSLRVLVEGRYDKSLFRDRITWCYGGAGEESRPRHFLPDYYYAREGMRSLYADFAERLGAPRREMPDKPYGTDWLTRAWTDRRGSMILAGHAADWRPPTFWNCTEIGPGITEQLNAMAHLTRERGVLLLVKIMPVWKGTFSMSEGAWRQLHSLEAMFANTVVCDSALQEFDPKLFFDGLHLNADGVALATAQLAAELERIAAARGLNLRKRSGAGRGE